ncbi:MAG: c-type cytochrome [Verrucomicrobiales bacterium]
MKLKTLSTMICALAVSVSAFFFVGCETTGTTGSASKTSAATASTPVAEGRRLFFGRCTSCHAPEPVHTYPLSEWRHIIADMSDDAKLTSSQRSALMAYVKSVY